MAQGLEKARNLTQIVYFLYAASIIIGVTAIVAIIINYIKRDEVAGTWAAASRTYFAAGIWAIYRIVKGMLNFYDNKPMYQNG